MCRAQMRRAARSFATSSKKSLCTSQKKERRGANASTSSPRARPRSTYVKPFASVKASSCAAVAPASRMIGVVAHQRREVEGDRQAGLAVLEQELVPLIGVFRRPEAGELPHRPQPPAIHGGVNPAGERVLARRAELTGVIEAGEISGGVQGLPLDVAHRGAPAFTWSRISAATS